MSNAQENLNADYTEYQLVFKMFDKDNTGEITMKNVLELINKFELREVSEDWTADGSKDEEKKEAAPIAKKSTKEPPSHPVKNKQ